MAATARDISEDWEHIDDGDTFSVISLPTSEDGSLDPTQEPPAIPESSSSSGDLIPASLRPQSEDSAQSQVSRLPETSRGSQASVIQPVKTCVTNMPDVVKSETTRAESRERNSKDSDFDCLAETASSLLEQIPVILSDMGLKVNSRYVVGEFSANCEKIRLHLGNLVAILHGYAKHERSSGRVAVLPLGVSDWLDRLKLELLAVQSALRIPTLQGHGSVAVSVSGYLKKLKGFSSQMDGLMAVIQSDYNDFHALHLPVVLASDDDVPSSSRAGHGHPLGHITSGNHSLAHLRRELYALKDQIAACLGEIHCYEHHGISNIRDQRKTMASLTAGYKKTKDSLEMMLSNHGGDWIDYSIAGGLTYPEFCRLNPDTIRSLILQLKEVTDDLFIERCRVQSNRCRNNTSAVAVSSVQELVFSEATMNTLRTIEEVLVSILQVRKCA
ncbi:hypothetical protein F5Y14DRAFT_170990 [Nemania sp. NC0429]|nr:hypothetical protein F5Y14DRAFT_170990 [Nemania sp. NC0429]